MRPLHSPWLFTLILIAACATPPAEPAPDLSEIAREILEEQVEAARAADLSADSSTSPDRVPVPDMPVWAQTEFGLQHIASGFVCPPQAAGFKRIGQDVFDGLGSGNDVACVYESQNRTRIRLHLTNFNRAVSPAAHLKGVETALKDAGAEPAALPKSNLRRTHATAFNVTAPHGIHAAKHTRTAVWIQTYGPWHVKARAFYAPELANEVPAPIERLFARARETLASQATQSQNQTNSGT